VNAVKELYIVYGVRDESERRKVRTVIYKKTAIRIAPAAVSFVASLT
jgi:hypothetical protein